MSTIKRRIVTILKDTDLPEGEKISVLRQLEADSLSKERSATEGMSPVDGDDGEDHFKNSGKQVHICSGIVAWAGSFTPQAPDCEGRV